MSLRFADERYVRVYTRDTLSWVLGPWQARAVLAPVLRKLDRAGTLDLGEEGLEALAVVIAMPLEVVEVGMAWWLKRGTFELVRGTLIAPNFLDAQEATASDAKRSREKRERARDLARVQTPDTKRDGGDTTPSEAPTGTPPGDAAGETASDTTRGDPDTKRDESSRGVTVATRSDTPSRAVPPEPSRTEPAETQRPQLALEGSLLDGSGEPASASTARARAEDLRLRAKSAQAADWVRGRWGQVEPMAPPTGSEPAPASDVREVFDHWAESRSKVTGCTVASLRLTPERRRKVQARLREGYTVDQLRKAIDGMLATPFNVEGNYTDLELVCRDAAHVDRYLQGPPTPTTARPRSQVELDAAVSPSRARIVPLRPANGGSNG